jgi:tetratricopeptide (TPR) repeat protein
MEGSAAVEAPTLNVEYVERHLAATPRDGGGWSTLGVLLRRAGKYEAALACHHRGLGFSPDLATIWSNLGNLLLELGRPEDGCAAYERAVALAPDQLNSWFNHVIGLRRHGRLEEAVHAIGRGLALAPDHVQLQWERCLTWLQLGHYARGFPAYEGRRSLPLYQHRVAPGPLWDGGPIEGRTILLTTEQGFGDALLMTRYIPLVKAKGGRIILECHPELRRVLADLPVDAFLDTGYPYPAHDVQSSIMSLPWLCGTTIDTVPSPVRLHVPEPSREKARRLLGPDDGTLRVGIVWSGRVTFSDNARRATSLGRFLRLAGVPGIRLFSLQKGPPELELADLGTKLLVTPLGPSLEDFADTAAVIEQLDLVVMTDSSVAHLAGSLGRPVWNLVQYMPYWIYGTEGASTPWYPSMRLFRQGLNEDWEPVFADVRTALKACAEAKRNRRE